LAPGGLYKHFSPVVAYFHFDDYLVLSVACS